MNIEIPIAQLAIAVADKLDARAVAAELDLDTVRQGLLNEIEIDAEDVARNMDARDVAEHIEVSEVADQFCASGRAHSR